MEENDPRDSPEPDSEDVERRRHKKKRKHDDLTEDDYKLIEESEGVHVRRPKLRVDDDVVEEESSGEEDGGTVVC